MKYPNVQITDNKGQVRNCTRSKMYILTDCISDSKPFDALEHDGINRKGRLGDNRDHQCRRRHDSCNNGADRRWWSTYMLYAWRQCGQEVRRLYLLHCCYTCYVLSTVLPTAAYDFFWSECDVSVVRLGNVMCFLCSL